MKNQYRQNTRLVSITRGPNTVRERFDPVTFQHLIARLSRERFLILEEDGEVSARHPTQDLRYDWRREGGDPLSWIITADAYARPVAVTTPEDYMVLPLTDRELRDRVAALLGAGGTITEEDGSVEVRLPSAGIRYGWCRHDGDPESWTIWAFPDGIATREDIAQ